MSADLDMASGPVAGPSGSKPSNRASAPQIPINLYTRSPEHSIPASTYLIPADWRRYQLSELINKVLKSDTPVPFDFLVNGSHLLRTTLDEYIKTHRDGDSETTLNVEYLESLQPPKKVASYPQDDWVSGVDVSRPGRVLMSSYLSHVKVIPLTSEDPITLPLPQTTGATCCHWLSDDLIGAGGMDRQGHVFSLSEKREVMTLHHHTGPISSIQANVSSSHVLTSSWDGSLAVFPLSLEESHDVPAEPTSYLPGQKKRRKVDQVGGGWRRAPEVIMRGHTARIGGSIWDRDLTSKVWSAAWDGSVRGWDAESGYQSDLKQGPSDRAALCIDQFAGSASLLTGNMDRTVCVWDTRESTSLVSVTINTPSPVPSLRAHPTSSYSFAAATYSGTIQIWDIRSPKQSLFTVASSSAKPASAGTDKGPGRLLALDWNGETLAAGGEEGEVGLWTAKAQ